MEPIVTIVIPCAPGHESLVDRAIASAQKQSIVCDIIPYFDREQMGAGYARNQGTRDCQTPFLLFLDADDELLPDGVQRMIQAYTPKHYVYSAWVQGEKIMRPRPCNPYLFHDFKDGRGLVDGYHLVTALIPTAAFRAVGGFDENLPGMEDTDLFLKLQRMGICGSYVDQPLLLYRGGEQESRSAAFKQHPAYRETIQNIYERNGGSKHMSDCGCGQGDAPKVSESDRQEGDVPVETLYAPMSQYGRATSRFYKRHQFMGQIVYVDPRDAQAMPDLFRRVHLLDDLTPAREDVLKAAGLI